MTSLMDRDSVLGMFWVQFIYYGNMEPGEVDIR